MSDQKISALLALSLLSSPLALPAETSKTTSSEISSCQRSSARRMRHLLAPTPTLQPMGTYVGQLQEKWQFPSDHLPIGMTFDNLHIVSWNVLNAKSMHWVTEENSQGLSRSLIADEHVSIGDSKLTIRDRHVVDLVLQMISPPRSILALQECSKPFIKELRSRLPAHFEIISSQGESLLLDRRLFEVVSTNNISGIFSEEPRKALQDITIRRRDNGQILCLINAHLPGDPTKPARFEFAQYLSDTFDPTSTKIAMGDMNFNELEMAEAMQLAFKGHSPFSLYSPYCTNISPFLLESKAIDHFLVYSPNASPVALNHPNEILPKLKATASLLQKSDYNHPPFSHHIDAPLPKIADPDQVVGIYGNILYPQDREQIQQKKLIDWIENYDPNSPFPLSQEEMNDLSLFILERFPQKILLQYFAEQAKHSPLEKAKQDALIRANLYREIAKKIPAWEGRAQILAMRFNQCADRAEQLIARNAKTIDQIPPNDSIEPPFTWDVRQAVFKQMVDKVLSASQNSPYFLALQEVTPQALNDLKETLADRDLQWVSFNNISGKETLPPQQEEVLGEATAFTSTLALSRDLEVLKVELGDLPTESGSIRKILGVKVRNTHNNEIFNLFTTHTDHKIQNDIYARTAAKISEFATHFFEDTTTRFVLGGDLNAFHDLGGATYVKKLRELFPQSQDFRETHFYAPNPIAQSSFIGHSDGTFSARIAQDGIVEPNALDHILVGPDIELQSAAREAAVYNQAGQLLDYYEDPEEYIENLQKRITFSDHFFNIVRFK